MKKTMVVLIGAAFLAAGSAFGAVSVTAATSAISADKAATAVSPAWTSLGSITIAEGTGNPNRGNFSAGTGVTLILKAPAGFEFNTAVTPNITFTAGRDITAASIAVNNNTTVTVTLTVGAVGATDSITIGSTTGLQVRPTAGAPLVTGIMYRPTTGGGTAVMNGLTTSANADGSGGTAFANLSEVAGNATKLVFTTSPAGANAGSAFSTQPVVKTQDQFNNNSATGLAATVNVTAAISSGTGSLQGTATLNIGTGGGNGTATFTNLRIDTAGAKQLTASATNLTSAVSSSFTVNPGPASVLAIQTQPSASATAGVAFAQQPVVRVQDAFGNLISTDNSTVVSAARNAGAGTLQGTTTATAANGVATFNDLFHTLANTITLDFSATSLTTATSSNIQVDPAVASQVVFTTQPGNASVLAPFGTQPVIKTRDQYGNDSAVGLSASQFVEMQLSSGTGPLLGTTNIDLGTAAGNGVAAFTNLQIDSRGTNNQLTAVCSGLTSAQSSLFDVNAALQSISFDPIANQVYGAADITAIAAASSGLPVTFSIVSGQATNTGNVISILGAGSVTVRATQDGNETYAPVTADQTFSVAPATLTVTADNQSRVYGAANPTLTYGITGFVNSETASVVTGSPSVSTAGSGAAVGTYPITVTAGDLAAANYTFAFVDGSLEVTPAALTITADNKSRAYGDANPTFTASYAGFVNGDDESVFAGTLSLSSTADSSSTIGNYPITVSGVTASNYSIGFVDGTLAVTPHLLSAVAANATRVYGAADPALTGSLSGLQNGDDITATYETTNVTASSAVGSYDIVPVFHDNNAKLTNYTVVSTNGVLTITKATVTLTADNQSRSYGATNPALTVAYSGFVNDETSAVLSGAPEVSTTATVGSSVGAYPISVAIGSLSAVNYDFTFVDGTLTVGQASLTATADNKSRAYGEVNPTFTASYSGFLNGDDESVLSGTVAGVTTADTNSPVGVYPISISGVTATNYSITFVDGELTVTPFALSVVAENATRAYGAAEPAFTGTLNGVQNGDDITATFETTNVTAASAVGTYAIIPVLHDPNSRLTNYTVAATNGQLTITKATVTLTADDQTRTYGALNPALTVAYSGFVNGETNDVITGAPDVSTAGTNAPVGTHAIVVTAGTLAAANYDFAFVDGTLTVQPAALVGQADNKSRVYGDANPAFTVSYSGFVNGEDATVLSGTVAGSTAATTNSPVGSYALSVSGQTGSNYTISYLDGTLTITPSVLTVVADDASKTYGSANPTFTGTLSGVRNTDDITANYVSVADAASAVGSYSITPVLVDPANRLTNYTVLSTNGTLSVTKATVTVTANDDTAVYGATTPAFTASYSGFVNGDSVSALSGSPNLSVSPAVSNAGSYAIVAAQGTLSASNYDFAFVDGTLTVTPASLTIKADDKSRGYGVSNPVFTATYTGLVNGDTAGSLSGALVFSTAADESSATGTYAISVSGQTSGNYTITYQDGTLTIGTGTITVTAVDASRAYGATNPVFSGSVSANVDGITATFISAATTNSPVGTYPIVPVFDDPNGKLANYAIQTNGTLTITKAALTIAADAVSRTYGAANPTLTGSISGIQNNEDITAVFSSDANATTGIGSYAIHAALNATNNLGDSDITMLDNYTISTNGALTITKATLSVAVDDSSRAYGVANPTFSGTVTGVLNGENITATYSTTATAASASGTYAITATLSDNSTGVLANYDVTVDEGTLTISGGAITVVADNASRTYGAANPTFTGTVLGVSAEDNITATYTTTASATSLIGEYAIVPVLDDHGSGALTNYSVLSSNGVLTVTKAALTVTPDNKGVGPGTNTPSFTSTTVGLQNGELVSVVYSNNRPASKATTGSFTITAVSATVTNGAGVDTSANYNISLGTGTLRVLVPVVITTQPKAAPAATVQEGMTAYMSVVAKGDGLTYQWLKDGNPIAGATKQTNVIQYAASNDTGSYTCVVSNGVNISTSLSTVLTVVPDAVLPKVAITSPKTKASTNNVSIVANGTAGDTARIVNVKYRLNGSAWQNVQTFTAATKADGNAIAATWATSLELLTGTNLLEVQSFDYKGNASVIVPCVFFYNVSSPLTVLVDNKDSRPGEGPGTYTGSKSTALVVAPDVFATNGASLYVNRGPHTLSATPGLNQIFTNWTKLVGGDQVVVSTNAKYTFNMETNLTLTANFIHNPYIEAGGIYNGLFTNATGDTKLSGFITLKIDSKLGYTGKLYVDNEQVGIMGKLNVDGTATAIGKREKMGKTNLLVNLSVLFGANGSSGTNQIVGTITDGTLTANFVADQWVFAGKATNDYKGLYTMVMDNATTDASGFGYGLLNIVTNGNVVVAGGLGDSTQYKTLAITVSKDGRIPFYAPLYPGKTRANSYTNGSLAYTNGTVNFGWLMGWLQVTNNTAIGGSLTWVKSVLDSASVVVTPPGSYTNYYTNGFTNSVSFISKGYVPPVDPKTMPLLSLTDGLITFENGNLPGSPQSQGIVLLTNNATKNYGNVMVVTNSTNIVLGKPVVTKHTNFIVAPTAIGTNAVLGKLAVGFDAKSGLIKGTFTNAMSLKPLAFFGAVLQPDNQAYGYFYNVLDKKEGADTNDVGSMKLEAIIP